MYVHSIVVYVGVNGMGHKYSVMLRFITVDGGWSEWKEETECSAKCGGGIVTKTRNCSTPSPSCGGRHCQGDNTTNASCNTHCCPGNNIQVLIFSHTRKLLLLN